VSKKDWSIKRTPKRSNPLKKSGREKKVHLLFWSSGYLPFYGIPRLGWGESFYRLVIREIPCCGKEEAWTSKKRPTTTIKKARRLI